ncbi:MAG TPA: L-aspartate oxidase [Candidatus Dormibacteraeota bacterium]
MSLPLRSTSPPDVLRCDVVVAGSGLAGMAAALSAVSTPGPVRPRVVLVTAGRLVSGCTRWAQGGLAAALGPDDSPQLHLEDTLAAGRGLCDEAAVRVLVGEGPARVHDLATWQVPFDRDGDGEIALGREAAHSRPRIVHAGGDATGQAIARTLAERLDSHGVEVFEGQLLVGLVDDGGRCAGVDVVDAESGAACRVLAPATVLATGGAGRLWLRTTNPEGAVGSGVALAYAAGAEVASMEFVQFHPTALALPDAPAFMITEAIRGEGAHVVDGAGRRFLFAADPRGELAPRDVVAAAIWGELDRSGAPSVFLDARHLPGVEARFPTVTETLRTHGLDLSADLVPIAPAAHYSIGGVRTDLDGATSLPGLYAAGEVASTGVHGANRLASNSLLEGVVFGVRAGGAAREAAAEAPRPALSNPRSAAPVRPDPAVAPAAAELQERLRSAMQQGAGLIRERGGLEAAAAAVAAVAAEADALPLSSTSTLGAAARTASLVCQAALLREESRGSHRRSDHPEAVTGQQGVWVLQVNRRPELDSHAGTHH